MERGLDSRKGTGRSLLNLAEAAVIALSATACTAASLSPSTGGAGASGSASPTTTGTSVVPTDIATPTQTPTPSLRSSGGVSSGTWTGLDWAAVPTGLAPTVPPVAANGYYPNAILEGWSKGYVELLWDPKLRTATPWVSADGLSWQVGSKLDTSVWLADMKAFDQENVDLSADCSLRIRHFEEGPETLLMTAYFICPVACGNGIVGRDATWTSSDGLSWTPLDRPKTFGSNGVGAISGGSSGFVALGGTSDGRILWLSADGQNWKHGTLPADARATGAEAYDPAAVAGGYVLPGALLDKNGAQIAVGGCAGILSDDLPQYTGALWWSPDGINWTRESLAGVGSGPYVQVNVVRVDDHMLLATELIETGSESRQIAWTSRDGKSWTLGTGLPTDPIVVPGRDQGLISTGSDSYGNAPTLSIVDDRLGLVALAQTGDQPKWGDTQLGDVQLALGPGGLLCTADGSRFWIGVPAVR